MHLFRVLPWLEGASLSEPGHALYVPPVQGKGRIDNPKRYRVLYASDVPGGAVGEAFANFDVWTDLHLAGPPWLPGSRRALAVYDMQGQILDLDDAQALLERALRPSHVVIRDRMVTQRWALHIFEEGRWHGVRWWSRHDARWGAYGLWNLEGLRVVQVEPLTRDHPAVIEAQRLLRRRWRRVLT